MEDQRQKLDCLNQSPVLIRQERRASLKASKELVRGATREAPRRDLPAPPELGTQHRDFGGICAAETPTDKS